MFHFEKARGRTSDKHVTKKTGFLDDLVPRDIVLVDRGFNINEMVGTVSEEEKIPSFTRGRSQMSARDIECTRELARLCVHVERVMVNAWAKHTVLTGTLPVCLVLPCEGERITAHRLTYVSVLCKNAFFECCALRVLKLRVSSSVFSYAECACDDGVMTGVCL